MHEERFDRVAHSSLKRVFQIDRPILQAAFSSLNINYQELILDGHEKMDYQFAAVNNHRLMLIPYHWHDGLKHGEEKRR